MCSLFYCKFSSKCLEPSKKFVIIFLFYVASHLLIFSLIKKKCKTKPEPSSYLKMFKLEKKRFPERKTIFLNFQNKRYVLRKMILHLKISNILFFFKMDKNFRKCLESWMLLIHVYSSQEARKETKGNFDRVHRGT